jgi:hypothetical protein
VKLIIQFSFVMIATLGTVFFTKEKNRDRASEPSSRQDTVVTFAGRERPPGHITDPSEIRNKQLQVTHYVLPGNQASVELAKVLRDFELENTFGDKVVFREVVITSGSKFAVQHGLDLRNFGGFLSFHSKGAGFEPLRDTVDKQVIHHRI